MIDHHLLSIHHGRSKIPPLKFELPSGWTPHTLATLHASLLDWFDREQRELPWRATRDPYRIWISEVMLQQTTVTAVVPYFHRFLAAFPDVHALASADEQEVLKLWEGLGYYRRARHLHAAAKILVSDHAGNLPDDVGVWEALPGVGPYILGAVLSQAFDRPLPIVEANSLRVLTRLLGYRGDPREGEGKNWVWAAARQFVPNKRAGDYNQGLMELGAVVCGVTEPTCPACPLSAMCVANREQLQDAIPPKKATKVMTEVAEIGVVIRQGSRVLLCRRPANAGRWQNLWEIPHAERQPGESIETAAIRIARELTGMEIMVGSELTTIKHTVTRYSITLVCVEASYRSGELGPGFYTEARWVEPSELGGFPVSSPQRKLMTRIASSQRQLF